MRAKGRAAETEQRNRGWLAWTTANLGRAKTMPPLDKVIGKPRGRKPQTIEQQAAALRRIAIASGGVIKPRGDS